MDVLTTIEMFGGIASRREIVGAGCWEMVLDFMILYRRVVRVRNGWFALPDIPEPSRAAWRVGGTLACISGRGGRSPAAALPSAKRSHGVKLAPAATC